MALILPKNYHKVAAIERNGISWIEPELAERQDIRPLRIGIINIMQILPTGIVVSISVLQ